MRMPQMYGFLFGPEMAKSFLRMSEDIILGFSQFTKQSGKRKRSIAVRR